MSEQRKLLLLADRVTEGLDPAEEAELADLLEGSSSDEIEEMELAAAALDLALSADLSAAEDALPRRLHAGLVAAVAAAQEAPMPAEEPGSAEAEVVSIERRPVVVPWLAAAACFVFAVVGWWRPSIGPSPVGLPDAPPAVREAAPPSLSELRTRLIGEAADEAILPWSATEDPTAGSAAGDVVWSAERQKGFMRFEGLAANDPAEFQYQLWIFDRERDERYPVDGGVFDMPAGSDEVIVPIIARLPVGDAYLFAITVEPPGGVVVSGRERIALVAQPV